MKNENKTITITISKSRNCDVMYGWDVYGDGAFTRDGFADEDVINLLLDSEFYSAGKVASNRERLWAIGLQMILEKYGDEGVHVNE